DSPALDRNEAVRDSPRQELSSSISQRPSFTKGTRSQGDLKSAPKLQVIANQVETAKPIVVPRLSMKERLPQPNMSSTPKTPVIIDSNQSMESEDRPTRRVPKVSPKYWKNRSKSPGRIPPRIKRINAAPYRRRPDFRRMDRIPADKDSSDVDRHLKRSRLLRSRYPPPPTLRSLGPLTSDNSSTPSVIVLSEQEQNNVEPSPPVQYNSLPDQPILPITNSVVRLGTDESPPYFYDNPPPAVVRQQFDLNPNYKIYIPEESTYTTQLIPPLIDQERIPRYIRAQYGDPPPYSTLWK
ncbi:hypothetical protein D915_007117, partial [Fasciola hepatica]